MAILESTADEPTVVEIPTGAKSARLRLPADADADAEVVAALVAAIKSRLDEQQEHEESATEETDRWRLAARVGARRRYELPRECRSGEEWTAAGRCP